MADEIAQPIESKFSGAWRLSKHEAAVLWLRWWPVAVLGLCDVLSTQSSDMQASKEAWCVRCGVILMGIINCIRVWATNNKNKAVQ